MALKIACALSLFVFSFSFLFFFSFWLCFALLCFVALCLMLRHGAAGLTVSSDCTGTDIFLPTWNIERIACPPNPCASLSYAHMCLGNRSTRVPGRGIQLVHMYICTHGRRFQVGLPDHAVNPQIQAGPKSKLEEEREVGGERRFCLKQVARQTVKPARQNILLNPHREANCLGITICCLAGIVCASGQIM